MGAIGSKLNSVYLEGERELTVDQITQLQEVEGQKFYYPCSCEDYYSACCHKICGNESLFWSLYYDLPKQISLVIADEQIRQKLAELR